MEQEHKKQSKLSEFFSDKTNRTLLAIIIISLIIRIYYFILTKNQAVWWDESEYLVTAKHWALGVPWDVNPQRPILFSLLFAIFYKLAIPDIVGKFFFVLLPSLGVIVISYLLAKEMYDKKIAILTSAFMSIFYVLIFNTTRYHTDALGVLLGLFAIYFFWKGYVNQKSKKLIWLVGIFLAFNFATRLVAVLIAGTILVYLILTTGLKFLRNKDLWISLGLGLIPLGIYLIYNLISYNKIFAFSAGYIRPEDLAALAANPPAWYVFSFIGIFLGIIMLIVFLVGIIFSYKLIIGYDLVIKEQDKKSFADLFIILLLLVHIIWFVFIQRAAEDRWLLPMAFGIFALVAKGLTVIYENIKKYNKIIASIALGVLLVLGTYHQLSLTDKIIKAKILTYSQEPLAGEFLKQNTNKAESIISNNEVAPLAYHTERKVYGFGETEQDTIKIIKDKKPKYLIWTAYFPSKEWTYGFAEKHKESLNLIKVYESSGPVSVLIQSNNNKPVGVAIYEFKNYNF